MPETQAGWGTLEKSEILSNGGPCSLLFWDILMRRRLRRVISTRWPVDVEELTLAGDDVALSARFQWGEEALVDEDGYIAMLALEHGELTVRIAAASDEAAKEAVKTLTETYPRSEPAELDIPITFWSYSPHGPRASNRRIAAADWDTIADNYTRSTRDALAAMMEGFQPAHGGQLVLWQGPAGTGKTWALRALAWEWRSWAEFHYIVDPDQLFGDHADYLIDVLLSEPLNRTAAEVATRRNGGVSSSSKTPASSSRRTRRSAPARPCRGS